MTGLDSARASLVMRILRTIASKQKTVIMTIHQPSSAIFQQFDRVMLMAPGGHLVFHGTAADASAHFDGLGHVLPPQWVPTDFWIDLISEEATAQPLIDAWRV